MGNYEQSQLGQSCDGSAVQWLPASNTEPGPRNERIQVKVTEVGGQYTRIGEMYIIF